VKSRKRQNRRKKRSLRFKGGAKPRIARSRAIRHGLGDAEWAEEVGTSLVSQGAAAELAALKEEIAKLREEVGTGPEYDVHAEQPETAVDEWAEEVGTDPEWIIRRIYILNKQLDRTHVSRVDARKRLQGQIDKLTVGLADLENSELEKKRKEIKILRDERNKTSDEGKRRKLLNMISEANEELASLEASAGVASVVWRRWATRGRKWN